MSDNDSITNSNGLVGGWTHLIPEECAVESVGPGDDGNESLAETPSPCEKVTCSVAAPETGGGVPPRGGADSEEWPHGTPASPEAPVESVGPEDDGRRSPAEATNLSEEVTGPVAEEEPGDGGVPPEAALSEEGLQVCQETTPESSTPSSPTVSSPSPSSHVPLISDQEGHTPFGLDTDAVTSPCSDTDGLIPDSTATDAYTHISSVPENLAADSPAPDAYTHISSAPEIFAADSPAHDTVIHTSSAPENLAADGSAHDTDTHISSAPELLAPDSPSPDTFTHVSPAPESYPDITPELLAPDSPSPDTFTHVSPAPESYPDITPKPFASANSAPETYTDISPEPFAPANSTPETYTDISPEPFAPASSAPEAYTDISPEPFAPASSAPEAYTDISPAFESQSPGSIPSASVLESQEGEEPEKEEEVSEPAKILAEVVPREDFRGDSDPDAPSYEGDWLRRRHAPPPGPPEPLRRVREEEEEEDEEEEFHLIVKKEERGGISLNKCIVGALVLLCLGSIIYTGYVPDLDGEEDSAQPEVHGKQERLNPDAKLPDPKEVAQLLGKLAEDNQQVAILQAQLQTQKDELDLVLQKAEEMVKEPPAGQTENHTTAHSRLWEGQNELASEEGDTGQEGEKTGVAEVEEEREEVEEEREEVEEERSGRTERAEKPVGSDGERKRQWEGRVREVRREARQEKEWKKGREQGKERRQREERKEKKGERDWKLGKDKHREWKEKVERRRAWEKGREWYGERKREGAWKGKMEKRDQRQDRWRGEKKEKDWKVQKEGWKEREERGMGKDKSKKEKHWQSPAEKKPRALDHADYWKRQQEKLEKNRPPVDCKSIAECARKEGLVPVKEAEFRGLLTSYLGKLGDDDGGASKGAVVSLVGEFFADGVFAHHRVPFREFVEDLADVLEDVAEGDRRLEEEMEEFEREALRRFAMAGGGEREGRSRGKDGRMWG
ncbi:hypothetical protein SKAU_G00312510 [Synaphobranchus kaupii]|uniref:Pre-B-cell leukemia transcription factor-interacting protein 1 n=1 Tax=Synaphobranchus kaupii TaxID=118154 RepID=A0A9Q1ES22_SYNKA|nr:hypothetical protein SKAU_G00312510 [Synaphobranchus kaupii]